MFCPNCGNVLEKDLQRCPKCMCSVTSDANPDDFYDEEYRPTPFWDWLTRLLRRPATIVSLAAVLVVCLVVTLVIPLIKPSAPEPEREFPWFWMSNGLLYFDASAYTGGPELTIPSTIDGQTVTGLGNGCFADCDGLTTVHLPETLTHIAESAFVDCSSLRGVYLPVSVTQIGAKAFLNCSSLEAISIPGGVTAIGADAFSGCRKLDYLFFYGTLNHWRSMYQTGIGLSTHVYAKDGVLYQGIAGT